VEPQIVEKYVNPGKVKLVWHDFTWIGRESQQAAQAARCAGREGKFWEYHDYLYHHQRGENQGQFSPANLKRFAGEVGLDAAAFDACLDKGEDLPAIREDLGVARSKNLLGTPGFVINGQTLYGASPSALMAALDAAVARTGA
jgi:protein-disulfide isomerase